MLEPSIHKQEIEGSSDRVFGLLFAAIFAGIGLWPLFGGAGVRIWSLALGGVFLVLALALPRALSEYLAAIEARAGVAPGALSPDSLRAAFAALPVDAIRCEASGDDPFFPIGATLDPCCTCEGLLANLAGHGLARDRVMRGENPLPTRPFSPLASDIKLL